MGHLLAVFSLSRSMAGRYLESETTVLWYILANWN